MSMSPVVVVAAKLLLVLFAVSNAEVYLEDNFRDKDSLTGWVKPISKDEEKMGMLSLVNKKYSNDTDDLGLKTMNDSRFYIFSKKFKPVNIKEKDVVIQYSIAFEQDIDCGGGYVKLFAASADQKKIDSDTPYYIMFGPDICGPSKRMVHVILNHNGTNHDCLSNIKCKDDVFTHVYTLIIKSNRTFIVKIDNQVTKTGDLYEEFNVLPPKKIKDPNSVKPSDWDDRQFIDDLDDKKPEDWDKPELIKDPKAKKPADWNDEEDGEWEPPMVENPEYKGEWKPKSKKNPDYKGPWTHPMIDNPDFFEDDTFATYKDIGVLAIEVWQVKAGTVFDNFLITDDVEYAETQAEAIVAKMHLEKELKKAADDEEMKKLTDKEDSSDDDMKKYNKDIEDYNDDAHDSESDHIDEDDDESDVEDSMNLRDSNEPDSADKSIPAHEEL